MLPHFAGLSLNAEWLTAIITLYPDKVICQTETKGEIYAIRIMETGFFPDYSYNQLLVASFGTTMSPEDSSSFIISIILNCASSISLRRSGPEF